MARHTSDGAGVDTQTAQQPQNAETALDARGASSLTLPAGDFINGDIVRDGQDLILRDSQGHEVTIENYFSATPTLHLEGGAVLTPALVESFARGEGPLQYAAAETTSDASPVGHAKEVTGEATVTRANGQSEALTQGAPIYQGDVIETKAGGAVNIEFVDESTFAVSANAKLAIDEFVFDPATQGGETNFSLLRGIFVFTSGLIGREDPDDVKIETPVGSIGIRGTTIAGNIVPGGASQITVVEGAIVIRNETGEVTLADQFGSVQLTGMDAPIAQLGQLPPADMVGFYGTLQGVAPAFFSTIQGSDAPAESGEAPADAPVGEAAPAEGEAAPAEGTAQPPAPGTQPLPGQPAPEGMMQPPPAPLPMNFGFDPFNGGFDAAANYNIDFAAVGTAGPAGAIMPPPPPPPAGTILMPPPPPPGDATTAASTTTATSTNTTTTTAPPPPLDVVISISVDDDDITAGTIVGEVTTTANYPGAIFNITQMPLVSGDPAFTLVNGGPGRMLIALTGFGAGFVSSNSVGALIGSLGIRATLPDGRTNEEVRTVTIVDDSGGGTVAPFTLDLNGLPAGFAGNAQGFSLGGVSGAGRGLTYLGDVDRNGAPNFAYIDNTGGFKNYNGSSGTPALFDIDTVYSLTLIGGATGFDFNIARMGDMDGDGTLDYAFSSPNIRDNNAEDQGQVIIAAGDDPQADFIRFDMPGSSTMFYGDALSGVGDLNADGFADVAFSSSDNTLDPQAFVKLGANNGFGTPGTPSVIDLDSPPADIWSFDAGTSMWNVAGAGDFNNDGFGDLAAGYTVSGTTARVDVILGSNGGVGANRITFTGLNITPGDEDVPIFTGDFTGDGQVDLLIGDTVTNSLYIVRSGAGWASGNTYNLTSDANVVRYNFDTTDFGEVVGAGNAGDFNGDGQDDIAVALRTGDMVDILVIYGGAGLTGTINVNINWMNNNPGKFFHAELDLTGHLANPSTDSVHIDIAGAEDINGDSFDDIILGLPENTAGAAVFGVYGRANQSLIDSGQLHAAGITTAGANVSANGTNQSLLGDEGVNVLRNYNGSTAFSQTSYRAGGGDDTLEVYGSSASAVRQLDGGAGVDTLRLMNAGAVLDFRGLQSLSGIERIDMAVSQAMTIGLDDIFRLMQESDLMLNAGGGNRRTLMISGDGAGTINIDDARNNTSFASAGFTAGGTHTVGADTYNVYTHGSGYQLLIENTLSQSVA